MEGADFFTALGLGFDSGGGRAKWGRYGIIQCKLIFNYTEEMHFEYHEIYTLL